MSEMRSDSQLPEYEDYQRPSVGRSIVGVIVGILIIAVAFVVAFYFLPAYLALILAPAIALGLLVAGAAVAPHLRRKPTQTTARTHQVEEQAEQAAKREKFEAWMDKELEEQHQEH